MTFGEKESVKYFFEVIKILLNRNINIFKLICLCCSVKAGLYFFISKQVFRIENFQFNSFKDI